MLLGVPVFAIIYYYFSKIIDKRLETRGMDVLTFDYEDYDKYAINKDDLRVNEEKSKELKGDN